MVDSIDNTHLHALGWRGELPAERVARVVARDRTSWQLQAGQDAFTAELDEAFADTSTLDAPAVGDFVVWEPGPVAAITRVLPRRGVLKRGAAGDHVEAQVIACNVDYVLVLTGLDRDFSTRRIERYLSLVAESGASPVVLLGKADQCDAAEARREALRERLADDVPVHLLDARAPESLDMLAPYTAAGTTSVLVGSSGAGKSTLTNNLLGATRMATQAVRRDDQRGRHTTARRMLLVLPTGGCLIDTPGMREVPLTGEESLASFTDISELAARCRFRDCGHGNEPGCAVQAALETGELNAARWDHYCQLRAEKAEHQARHKADQRRRGEGSRPRPAPLASGRWRRR